MYKNNTLIFVVEDDAQDGGDHIDSHRTTAYVAGAYVKDAVVSTAYTTLDFMRTIEEVLGLPPMNLNDALATPMADIFNTVPNREWTLRPRQPQSFTARICLCQVPGSRAITRRPMRDTGLASPRAWTSTMQTALMDLYSIAFYGRG